MNNSVVRTNKRVIILTIILTILIIVAIIGGYFLYKNYADKKNGNIFSLGYNQSLVDVAQGQTQTGNILIWQNDSIQVRSIQDICSGVF